MFYLLTYKASAEFVVIIFTRGVRPSQKGLENKIRATTDNMREDYDHLLAVA